MDITRDAIKINKAHKQAGMLLFWSSASNVLAVIITVLSGADGMLLVLLVQVLSPALLGAGALLGAWACRDSGIRYPFGIAPKDVLAGVLCAVLMWPGAAALSSLGGTDPAGSAQAFDYVHGIGLPAALLVTALLPALCEEFLFRGFLYGAFSKRCAAWGILASSAGFAMLHGSPVQALYAAYCGLVLGCVRYATGSLVPGMAAHFLFNASSLVLAYYGGPVTAEPATGTASVLTAAGLFILAVLCTACIRWILRRTHARNGSFNEAVSGWPAWTAWSLGGFLLESVLSLLLRW